MSSFALLNPAHRMLTVSELNTSTRQFLEQNIPLMWIKGEISNLKCYQSGHWYFSLKDSDAQVRCVMFSHKRKQIDWLPEDGMQVEVLALVTLYELRGDFQLNIETMRRAGLGALFEAFEKLKIRLEQSGFFNPANKKPLPAYPRQIGIITSPDTAALRDVLSTLQRRMPSLPVIVYPTPVQGKSAAGTIAEAIRIADQRAECDVLILCRGGGSIEDLWPFNEEIVARSIAASFIPIVSGIGHETDFTIADFVADIRAPTPTAAAEMISRDYRELIRQLKVWYQRMHRTTLHRIEYAMQHMDMLTHRLIYPGDQIKQQFIRLQHLQDRLIATWAHRIEKQQWQLLSLGKRLTTEKPDLIRLEKQQDERISRFHDAFTRYFTNLSVTLNHQQTQLSHLNPNAVLERGYSITYTQQNIVIRDSRQLQSGDRIQVRFARGMCEAEISKTGDS